MDEVRIIIQEDKTIIKRYIKNSITPTSDSELKWIYEVIDGLEADGEISPEEADQYKQINWGIDVGDAEIVIKSNPEILQNAKSIKYEVSDELHEMYDGGYLVTYKNGKSKMYGWLDVDTLNREPQVYAVD